jgi:hypothetical protein
MNKAPVIRWSAVLSLGIASLCLFHPRFSSKSEINMRGYEAFALAESIINHHTFADPFLAAPTGPSAHLPPLFPAYLALILKVSGHGRTGVAVLMWVTALMLTAQLMMLPMLAQRLGLGFWTGVLASLAWLSTGAGPNYLGEATLTSFLVISVVFFMRRSFDREMSTLQVSMSVVLWGILLLLQPVTILVLFFWWLLLHGRSQISTPKKVALGLLPIVVLVPWTIRNLIVFHQPVFVRDSLGLELAVSNNFCASPLFDVNQNDGCFSEFHPNLNYEEALRVQRLGEVEYNRVRLREATSWIEANPRRFVALSAERFEAFWFPPASYMPGNGVLLHPLVLHCFTLLSLAGLFLAWRNARVATQVMGMWLVFFPLAYYFVQFMVRYRYPILWATFIPGSYFIVELVRGIAIREEVEDKRPESLAASSEPTALG